VRSLLHDVELVEHLGGHRLRLRFDDGAEGQVDLRDVVTRFDGVLAPLADPKFVRKVRVHPEFRTITWPGELDLDLVVLYCVMRGIPVPGEKRPRTRGTRRRTRVPATRVRAAPRARRRQV
jgi:hypothetical protein